jgi:hypothetical protein
VATETKPVYGGMQKFVAVRTIKDHHHHLYVVCVYEGVMYLDVYTVTLLGAGLCGAGYNGAEHGSVTIPVLLRYGPLPSYDPSTRSTYTAPEVQIHTSSRRTGTCIGERVHDRSLYLYWRAHKPGSPLLLCSARAPVPPRMC